MDLKLVDKIVLITGSTAGIGFAIAKAFSSEGARTIINGRSENSVTRAINDLKSSTDGEVLGFTGDLSLESVAADLIEAHPRVDILVNNLGIYEPVPFEEIPDEDWRRFFEVNVLSGVRLSRIYLPSMKERNWGRIIFISSESGIQIPAEMIHYGMTKAAQIAIARGLAEHVTGADITVNSVLTGSTKSRGVGDFATSSRHNAIGVPFPLPGQPQPHLKEFFSSARLEQISCHARCRSRQAVRPVQCRSW